MTSTARTTPATARSLTAVPPSGLRTLDEIRQTGLATLTPTIRAFLEGGSGSELTLRRNMAGFDDWLFQPRLLSGIPSTDTTTRVLGIDLALPIMTAPFGADGYFHPEGQRAVGRTNERYGIVSVVPEAGTFSLEDVAAAAPKAAAIGQLHPMGSDATFLAMVRRYEDAGYRALCLTCDFPVPGWRQHNLVTAFNIDNRFVGGNYPPGASLDLEHALGQLRQHDEPVDWTWRRMADLLQQTSLPWMAKGLLTVEDAEIAVAAGAAAVAISNHGGRQLDGVPSPIDVLPAIAAAVGGRADIVIDSGIRRGSDIVKAVALGADAVMIGRLPCYGLAAAGEQGTDQVLHLLQKEIETVLILLGRGGIADLDPRAVARAPR